MSNPSASGTALATLVSRCSLRSAPFPCFLLSVPRVPRRIAVLRCQDYQENFRLKVSRIARLDPNDLKEFDRSLAGLSNYSPTGDSARRNDSRCRLLREHFYPLSNRPSRNHSHSHAIDFCETSQPANQPARASRDPRRDTRARIYAYTQHVYVYTSDTQQER